MYEDPAHTKRQKQAFAAAYLRMPNDAYSAAKSIEPHFGRASRIAVDWPFDDEVVGYMGGIQQERGVAALIPGKEEFAYELLTAGREVADRDTKLKYYDLFAKTMGYVEKPGTGPALISGNGNKVMIRVVYDSPDQWEAMASKQQADLVLNAAG